MNKQLVCTFLIGATAGASTASIIYIFRDDNARSKLVDALKNSKVYGWIDEKLLNRSKDIKHEIEVDNASKPDSGTETDNRPSDDTSWTEDDRKRVSDFLHSSEVSSSTELEDSELVITDENEQSEDDDIIEITPSEFVKAVANGKYMRSFIFDVTSRQLVWNFTDEPLTDEEVKENIGQELHENLVRHPLPEYIQCPIYLYNKKTDIYSKIELGVVV